MTLKEVTMVKLMQERGWKVSFMMDSMTDRHYVKAERIDRVPLQAASITELFDFWTDDPKVAQDLLGIDLEELT